jgi:hypothetical protein
MKPDSNPRPALRAPGEARFARLGSVEIISEFPPAVSRSLWAGSTRVCLARLGGAAIQYATYRMTVRRAMSLRPAWVAIREGRRMSHSGVSAVWNLRGID